MKSRKMLCLAALQAGLISAGLMVFPAAAAGQDCSGGCTGGERREPVLEISELDPDGDNEWIELYNPSDCPETLAGYILELQRVDGIAASTTLPAELTVCPRDFLVICIQCRDSFCDACIHFDSSEVKGLDSDGGAASLYWQPPGETGAARRLCSMRYPAVPAGLSFGRPAAGGGCKPDGCEMGPQTPGLPNGPCKPNRRSVVINEISTSEGSDGSSCLYPSCPDWIELYWLGPDPVNLAGYRLDNRGEVFNILTPFILDQSNRFALVICSRAPAIPGLPPNTLRAPFQIKASGDSIELASIDGGDWDRISIPGLQGGEYYSRTPDGGDFAIASTPTPGASNPPARRNLPPGCAILQYQPVVEVPGPPGMHTFGVRADLRILPGDWVRVWAKAADPDDAGPAPEDGLDAGAVALVVSGPGTQENIIPMSPGRLQNCQDLPEAGIFQAEWQAPPDSADLAIRVRAADRRGLAAFSEEQRVFIQGAQEPDPMASPRINEIAANETNEDGDWVELYNPTQQPLLTAGLYLTDDLRKLNDRQLPLAIIPPLGFLVVHCDNQLGLIRAEPHLPFALDKCRGEIYLLEYDAPGDRRTIIDALPFQKERRNKSLGRYPDGSGLFTLMEKSQKRANERYPCFDFTTRADASLVINEVLADNWATRADRRGSLGDLIEIYNRGAAPERLDGWSLADHQLASGALMRWQFPAGICLPPEGRLVVWCDADEGETDPIPPGTGCSGVLDGELHASFNINHLRDFLFLLDASSRPAGCVAVRYQARDISVGRSPDGAEHMEFQVPTPGAANPAPGQGEGRLAPISCAGIEELNPELGFNPCRSAGEFRRGNANGDEACDVDISDAVSILEYLFVGIDRVACRDAADIDDNGSIEITDAIHLLRYRFAGGPAPAPPFPEPGMDLSEDRILPCAEGLCR